MKIILSRHSGNSGQFMAEACIGLALMAFTWILLVYSLFLGTNQIRSEMAARYAAWYQANNSGAALPSASSLDQYFFYQTGLSSVANITPAAIGDVIEGNMPSSSTTYGSADGSAANGPFKAQVTFDPSVAANQFPYNLLNTQVPFMPNSMLQYSKVVSFCQWDGDSDCWTSPGAAFSGVISSLKSSLGSLF
jgi:hypothetical protein